MAVRQYWIGSFGPFTYNDADLFGDGSRHRLATDRPPVAADDMIRFQDVGGVAGNVVQVVATANIWDPTELNAMAGSANGALVMVAETAALALDQLTLYSWDSNPGAAPENPPYTVDGNAGSMWVAVAGKFPYAPQAPQMTTAQRNALTAVNGMIIYNTTTNAFNFYENGAWVTGSGLT